VRRAVLNDDEMNAIDCTETKPWLGRFYDGELDVEERARVEEHLRQCRDCARELEELRELDSILHSGIPEGGLDRRVAEAIGRGRTPAWWLGAAAAAVLPLALGALAGNLLFNGHAESPPDGSTTASLIEESFGPGSLRGIDDLARDRDQRVEEGQ
jgi:anti-sigma factor RsiW